jgi:SAM-dependent methyltransferase
VAFDGLKARQAAAWGSGEYELVAATLTDTYDELIDRLGVRPGERWLDVATGTGAVAIRAARKGATVTGQDLAAELIDTARRLAVEAGVSVRFDVGDCEQLPYPEGAFDVVCSAQGAVLAPNHESVARELIRVCRPGGRLGLTAWRPGGVGEQSTLALARFRPPPPQGVGAPLDWGRPDYVEGLLGEAFTLEFFEEDAPLTADSAEALWDLFLGGFGPVKALAAGLDAERRRELHDAFVEFYSRHLDGDGHVCAPREYTVIIGQRRSNTVV